MYGKEQHGEKDDGVHAEIYIYPLTLCHIHCHCIHNLRTACEKYENAAMLIMMSLPCILW